MPPFVAGSVPVTPVVRGKPVALVSVPDVGVPKIGVTSVGLVDRTTLPVPVEVVTPVPPLATGNVPVTLVAKLTKVVELVPVPPDATGRGVSKVSEDKKLIWSPTSVPLLYTTVRLPVGTATPVRPETFTVTA